MGQAEYWSALSETYKERITLLVSKIHIPKIAFLINTIHSCPVWFLYNYLIYLGVRCELFSIYLIADVSRTYGAAERANMGFFRQIGAVNFDALDLQLHLEITYILNSFLSPEQLDIKKIFLEQNHPKIEHLELENDSGDAEADENFMAGQKAVEKKLAYSKNVFQGVMLSELFEKQLILLSNRIESTKFQISLN